MSTIRGVPLSAGREALAECRCPLWWRGKSRILLAGTEDYLPRVRLQRTDFPDSPIARRGGLGFGLQNDEAMEGWAARCGIRLMLPSPDLTNYLGDKSTLGTVLGEGIPRPRDLVIDNADESDATRLWQQFGAEALVVQLTPNNLTGVGTHYVTSRTQLATALRLWTGQRMKVAQYIDGVNLTVSGCVGMESTGVSGVSHQLVGIPELTPIWGAHCGNQLLGDEPYWSSTVKECRRVALSVGDRLREHGFLGMFGLDLIRARDGSVFVVELNPRIQSVSALLSFREASADVLPSPGAHLLAHLGANLPVDDFDLPSPPPLSQLVLTAFERQQIRRPVPAGRYQSDGTRLHQIAMSCHGPAPAANEVIVWPFAQTGQWLNPADRILVAMTGRIIAPVGAERSLGMPGRELVGQLRALMGEKSTVGS